MTTTGAETETATAARPPPPPIVAGDCGGRGDTDPADETARESSRPDVPRGGAGRPRRGPWMAALCSFYFFVAFWGPVVVVKRYWIDEGFDVLLPGLDKSAFRKHTMRLHLTLGALGVACAPIQMISPFTKAWKRAGRESSTANESISSNTTIPHSDKHWVRRLHRYSGRLYVVCAILSYICGQWFIILKEFLLVGGYNMGIAFSLSGVAIAYFAYMTYLTAPRKGTKHTIEDHRNYAIRSFSQMIAPLLYRYWYTLLMIYNAYRTPYMNKGDPRGRTPVCDDRDVCEDYARPFDAAWCWLYWLSAWAVAEAVICCLPKRRRVDEVRTTDGSGGKLSTPAEDETSLANTEDESASEDEDEGREGRPDPVVMGEVRGRNALVLNVLGCLLAAMSAMVTGPIVIKLVVTLLKWIEKQRSATCHDVEKIEIASVLVN